MVATVRVSPGNGELMTLGEDYNEEGGCSWQFCMQGQWSMTFVLAFGRLQEGFDLASNKNYQVDLVIRVSVSCRVFFLMSIRVLVFFKN